ncbi:hypothetical protein VAZ01S_014_00430 [Vibrio azureus NBRC 104587]|uniref:Uncharacterized protein n=1 Tax=Vibrio azureus NBRC 104587 TaxID=1219077 RepID=U3ALV2_9VIBR|nr:hypothetical protein VAZ01S_014_00430 [Vibrio azureus NBRC 104587]
MDILDDLNVLGRLDALERLNVSERLNALIYGRYSVQITQYERCLCYFLLYFYKFPSFFCFVSDLGFEFE